MAESLLELTTEHHGPLHCNKSVQKLFKIGDNLALPRQVLLATHNPLPTSLLRFLSSTSTWSKHDRQGCCNLTANILSGRHTGFNSHCWCRCDGSHVYSIDSAGGSIPDVYCATVQVHHTCTVFLKMDSRRHEPKRCCPIGSTCLNASGQRDAASGNGMDSQLSLLKTDSFLLNNPKLMPFSEVSILPLLRRRRNPLDMRSVRWRGWR